MKRLFSGLNTRLAFILTALVVWALCPRTAMGLMLANTTTAFNAGGTSDINTALKIFFNEPVIENIVQDSELLALFEEDNNVKQDETTGGRYIETAQYFQLPAGVGARAENEYIPVPDGPVIQNSRVYLKKIQGVLEMTGDVMRRVKGDMGAYLNWADRALPDLVKRVDHELDRMLIGLGNGAKARIAAGGIAGNVITVDRSFGVTGNLSAWLNFMEGERLVASANANGNPLRNAGAGQSCQVVTVDQDNGKITVDAIPGAWAANDFLFAGDVAGVSTQDAGGTDREIMGLLGMVDDGTVLATFQNIVRATYPLWKSVVVDGSVAPYNGVLSEDLVVYGDDAVYIKGAGKISTIVSSRSGLRSYWKSLKGDRMINSPEGPTSYQGGRGRVRVLLGDRNVEIRAVRKMPDNLTFGLETGSFKRWTLGGWQWDDTTGAIWNRVTDATGRKDAYYAVGNMYLQMGCLIPRHNLLLKGLSAA